MPVSWLLKWGLWRTYFLADKPEYTDCKLWFRDQQRKKYFTNVPTRNYHNNNPTVCVVLSTVYCNNKEGPQQQWPLAIHLGGRTWDLGQTYSEGSSALKFTIICAFYNFHNMFFRKLVQLYKESAQSWSGYFIKATFSEG